MSGLETLYIGDATSEGSVALERLFPGVDGEVTSRLYGYFDGELETIAEKLERR